MSNMVISSGLYCLGLGLFLLQVLSVSMQELLQCGIVRCECLYVFALVYLSSCPLTVSFLKSKLDMCLLLLACTSKNYKAWPLRCKVF